ncbi:hypothetical protein HG530_014243 [Fusarium avenaceum]|nr:hypothetical protein HG530_014243 [Fusarium avenaceum]
MKAAVIRILWLFPALAAAQSSTVTLSPWQTGEVTPDGTCGGSTGFVCSPVWGACCSGDGMCGRSSKYCGKGCQSAAGNCNAAAPPPELPPAPGSVSPDGSCGGTINKFVCGGSPFGDCCSAQGWCGNSTSHCGNNCLPDFGICGPPSNISSDGQCGSNGKVCLGSGFGDCCSASGWCGDKTDHCGAGCQNVFGKCTASDSGDISVDGSCGKNGKTCKGSSFGDCCSADGHCGKTDDHCSAGCQSRFGTCAAETNISTDGKCGTNWKTCKGSKFGDCCSAQGWCGKEKDHCGTGCQSQFGTCEAASGNISTDSECGSRNGKTCVGSGLGLCCSANGFCGTTYTHCGQGCQKGFSSACMTKDVASQDGTCGDKVNLTCAGGPFNGQCCSAAGFCGTSTHCGSGCQKGFGRCN